MDWTGRLHEWHRSRKCEGVVTDSVRKPAPPRALPGTTLSLDCFIYKIQANIQCATHSSFVRMQREHRDLGFDQRPPYIIWIRLTTGWQWHRAHLWAPGMGSVLVYDLPAHRCLKLRLRNAWGLEIAKWQALSESKGIFSWCLSKTYRKRKQRRKAIRFTFEGWHSCGHLINSLFKSARVIKRGDILRALGHHLIAGSSKLLNETPVVWKQLMNHLMNGTLVYLEAPKRLEWVNVWQECYGH